MKNIPSADIQTLIADLDRLIHDSKSRTGLLGLGKTNQPSQKVLEEIRRYLVALEHDTIESSNNDSPNYQIAPSTDHPNNSDDLKKLINEAVSQEMALFQERLISPLQTDLEELTHRRESLIREIRQLENTRQRYYSISQQQTEQQKIITDFLQTLSKQLKQTIAQQVAISLKSLENQFLTGSFLTQPDPIASTPELNQLSMFPLHPQQRLEQMRHFQNESDRLLLTLDSTMKVVFESLGNTLQTYEHSLIEKLEKIQNIGIQNEIIVQGLIDKLTEQISKITIPPTPIIPPSPPIPPIPEPVSNLNIPPTKTLAQNYQTSSKTKTAPEPTKKPNINDFNLDDLDFDIEEDEDLNTIIATGIAELQSTHGIPSNNNPPPPTPEPPTSNHEIHNEIDELYEMMFGTPQNTVPATTKPLKKNPTTSLEPTSASTEEKVSQQAIKEIEEALFSGLTDPALQSKPNPKQSTSLSQDFWEEALFLDSSNWSNNNNQEDTQPKVIDLENVYRIKQLTDLIPDTTRDPFESQILGIFDDSDYSGQLSHPNIRYTTNIDESFPQASPQEDLLVTGQLSPRQDIDLLLNDQIIEAFNQEINNSEEITSEIIRNYNPYSNDSIGLGLVDPNLVDYDIESLTDPDMNREYQLNSELKPDSESTKLNIRPEQEITLLEKPIIELSSTLNQINSPSTNHEIEIDDIPTGEPISDDLLTIIVPRDSMSVPTHSTPELEVFEPNLITEPISDPHLNSNHEPEETEKDLEEESKETEPFPDWAQEFLTKDNNSMFDN